MMLDNYIVFFKHKNWTEAETLMNITDVSKNGISVPKTQIYP